MVGTSRDVSDELIASLEEAVAIAEGRKRAGRVWAPPATVDVKAIRARRGLSQTAFADRYGFTASTIREWEQGRRTPEQAARTLLLVIDQEPDAVERVLEAIAAR